MFQTAHTVKCMPVLIRVNRILNNLNSGFFFYNLTVFSPRSITLNCNFCSSSCLSVFPLAVAATETILQGTCSFQLLDQKASDKIPITYLHYFNRMFHIISLLHRDAIFKNGDFFESIFLIICLHFT